MENCTMNHKLILASASPRRKELLQELGLTFDVVCSECDEFFDTGIPVEEAIKKIAYTKAKAIFDKHQEAIVIGADTMVYYQGNALGKPNNQEEAIAMLRLLSGNTHEVISGVAILSKDKVELFHEVTEVKFYELDNEFISWYISSGESYDKAGAYGIQGKGKLLVESIKGDYFNIVGLPIAKVYRYLKKIN